MNIFNAIFRRRFNLFLTIYFNFRFLPFNQAIQFPIYVFGSWKLHLNDSKIVINAPVKRGMIWFGINIAGYVEIERSRLRLKSSSKIVFNGPAYISQGCQIYLDNNAILEFGKDIRLGDGVKIICYRNIYVGERSEITWESQVTDFNSHFIEHLEKGIIHNIYKSVHIGSHCWIGNRSTIMPGTVLPDRIIVASNSLLNKDYKIVGIESFSLLGGIPARLIAKNVKRIYVPENEKMLKKYFIDSNFEPIYFTDGVIFD